MFIRSWLNNSKHNNRTFYVFNFFLYLRKEEVFSLLIPISEWRIDVINEVCNNSNVVYAFINKILTFAIAESDIAL